MVMQIQVQIGDTRKVFFFMIPPESVEDFKKNYILHDLHLHDSEGMFYGFWFTLRKRSRRICSVG